MEIPEVKEVEGNPKKNVFEELASNLTININQIPKELNKAWIEWEIYIKYKKNLL